MASNRHFTRSNNAWIGGVCGGIADYFGWSANTVRLLYVLLSCLSAGFPGTLVYILLWIFLPPPGFETHSDRASGAR